jgi:chromosome segregation ATPase
MAEVSSELIYELAKQIRDDVATCERDCSELKSEMQAFRGHMIAMQQDIHNIYATLYRYDDRLERIERRLDLVEPATA